MEAGWEGPNIVDGPNQYEVDYFDKVSKVPCNEKFVPGDRNSATLTQNILPFLLLEDSHLF